MTTSGFQKETRILLTGGRAPAALELARLLHHAGHRVFTAESLPYHMCRNSSAVERSFQVSSPKHKGEDFLRELHDIIEEQQIDVLLPTCEEIFHIARGKEQVGQPSVVRWIPSIEILHALHHKAEFVHLAEKQGLLIPRTTTFDSLDAYEEIRESQAAYDQVLKPVYSRFGTRVQTVGKDVSNIERQRIMQRIAPFLSPATPWVCQERIRGRELSTYSVVHDGNVVAHADYWNDYRYGQGACIDFQPAYHSAALDWVQRFVNGIGFTGQIAFDFIEEEQSGFLYAIECNPRATSGLHLFSLADQLERAFLEPEALVREGVKILPRRGTHAILRIPMLLSALQGAREGRSLFDWAGRLRLGKDVIYRKDDPKPSWEQYRMLLHAMKTSRSLRIPLTEVMTYDMEWNGEA